MKIAVASSGLGHIARGIETWAADTASALHHRGVDVTLYAAAPLQGVPAKTVVLPCLKRNDPLPRAIVRMAPGWTWRWHIKSTYAIEQCSFWHFLHKQLRKEQIDILHVQDPLLAVFAQKAFQTGASPARCILAHGTEEPATFLQQLRYVQHLAPWHLQQTVSTLQANGDATAGAYWVALPNFVDTQTFCPAQSQANKHALRRTLHLPVDACIWGTAAAIKKHHKRIDWLIREFAAAAAHNPKLHLLIAGSRQTDTDALIQMAKQLCPHKITFAVNHPHASMPDLLRTLDAFVLPSLFEMMPIAILEAISTGLPVFAHQHPVLAWMVGPGGCCIDMGTQGTLAAAMQHESGHTLASLGKQAREHAQQTFATGTVIPGYIDYYQKVLQKP